MAARVCLQGEDVAPTVHTYSVLITCLNKAGEWERSLAMFEEMRQRGLQADAVCLATFFSACERGGECNRALKARRCNTFCNTFCNTSVTPSVTPSWVGSPVTVWNDRDTKARLRVRAEGSTRAYGARKQSAGRGLEGV
eukprot:1176612-Prorocentrum_minimum.AAC.6